MTSTSIDPIRASSLRSAPAIGAITHVALTVRDLSVSVPWYRQVIGIDPVLDEDTGPFRHVVFALGETLLGLHEFPEKVDETAAFDPRRPGLDHVAFSAQDRAELDRWRDRSQQLGVRCGEVKDAHYGSGLSFKDPDGLPLELLRPGHLSVGRPGAGASRPRASAGRRGPQSHRSTRENSPQTPNVTSGFELALPTPKRSRVVHADTGGRSPSTGSTSSVAATDAPSVRIVAATAVARARVSGVKSFLSAADRDPVVGVGPSCAAPMPRSATRPAQYG